MHICIKVILDFRSEGNMFFFHNFIPDNIGIPFLGSGHYLRQGGGGGKEGDIEFECKQLVQGQNFMHSFRGWGQNLSAQTSQCRYHGTY